MEITITVNGKPVKATMDEKEMQEAMGEKKKKTGYEYAQSGYFYVDSEGVVKYAGGPIEWISFREYTAGNHYRDSNVAKNNARADALMRKLRRFAAEHGGCKNPSGYGHEIFYDKEYHTIEPIMCTTDRAKNFGSIIFQSSGAAEGAIETFKDELIWYFTEYDPMPEGWWED